MKNYRPISLLFVVHNLFTLVINQSLAKRNKILRQEALEIDRNYYRNNCIRYYTLQLHPKILWYIRKRVVKDLHNIVVNAYARKSLLKTTWMWPNTFNCNEMSASMSKVLPSCSKHVVYSRKNLLGFVLASCLAGKLFMHFVQNTSFCHFCE